MPSAQKALLEKQLVVCQGFSGVRASEHETLSGDRTRYRRRGLIRADAPARLGGLGSKAASKWKRQEAPQAGALDHPVICQPRVSACPLAQNRGHVASGGGMRGAESGSQTGHLGVMLLMPPLQGGLARRYIPQWAEL